MFLWNRKQETPPGPKMMNIRFLPETPRTMGGVFRFLTLLTLLCALACAGAGCKSSGVPEPPGGVSVELRGNTPGQIFAAADDVFAAHGYRMKVLSPQKMWCEKPASTMSNIAYGDWLPDKPLYIRVKLTLVEHGEAYFRLHAQACKVTDRGGLLEGESVVRMGTGSYRKMLEEVVARLRGPGY